MGEGQAHGWCMARTNIDIDDDLCRQVMARFNLAPSVKRSTWPFDFWRPNQ